MDIKIHKTNFNAKFIKSVNIKSFDSKLNKYTNKEASVVEIDPLSRNDVRAINETVGYWENDSYGSNIANAVNTNAIQKDAQSKDKVYALTLQNNYFDKLVSDDIQGLMEVYDTGKVADVFYLQVNPNLVYTLEPPKYKHVGQELIKTLQNDSKEIINLYAVKSAQGFYKKLGFNKVNGTKTQFKWISDKIDK